MSDAVPDTISDMSNIPSDHDLLPSWVVRELGRPVAVDRSARERIMARVRASPPPSAARLPGVRRRRGGGATGWRARRGLAPLTGLAAAAGLACAIALGAARMGLSTAAAGGGVGAMLRDTVQAAVTGRATLTAMVAAGPAAGAAWGDSSGSALLRDTLRLVRFVLVAPTATRLALVGDFNGWSERATPMLAVAESTGMWEARVALRAGAHRYAFVQDDTQWVAVPGAGRVEVP